MYIYACIYMKMSNQKGSDSTDNHVHFKEEEVVTHNSEIITNELAKNHFSVHLGFLQVRHVYEIQFSIKDDLGEVKLSGVQNPHAKLLTVVSSKNGNSHNISVQLDAHHEKLLQELIVLESITNPEKKLTLELQARVMGKYKGTPVLKNGIHFVRLNKEVDSDTSD